MLRWVWETSIQRSSILAAAPESNDEPRRGGRRPSWWRGRWRGALRRRQHYDVGVVGVLVGGDGVGAGGAEGLFPAGSGDGVDPVANV
ncbi:MAG: hypothetical protein ACRD0K_11735 [Egibacteraceae bacterium]